MIPVSGGSNDIGGGHKRVITLPDTVDPVAVKDGECSFEPLFLTYGFLGEGLEGDVAKYIYEVVEPQDEANSGRRVKITARSDVGYGDIDVPWTDTITMICPERRCSFYFYNVATLPSIMTIIFVRI